MNEQEIANAYLESLLEEMDEKGLTPPPIRPAGFGFTVKEYMNKTGSSEGPARGVLERAVKKGVLVRHAMVCGVGTSTGVYCRPSEWPPKL